MPRSCGFRTHRDFKGTRGLLVRRCHVITERVLQLGCAQMGGGMPESRGPWL